jgi:hypothetical protein
MGVLEVVETALGQGLDKRHCIENLERSDSWVLPLWQALRPLESLTDDELRSYVPKREVGWLQPYLPYRISNDGREFVGALPVYDGATAIADPPRAAALLSRHALYCNRVVIDDPVWWAICDQVGYSYGGELHLPEGDRARLFSPERKRTILSWLDVLRAIRPLLVSERVVLLPPRDYDPWPHNVETPADLAEPAATDERLRDLKELQVDLERNGMSFKLPDQGLDDEAGRRSFAEIWFGQAVDDMALQLGASAFHNNWLDPSLVNSYHPVALQELLAAADAEATKRFVTAPGHAARLATLTRLPALLDVGEDPSRLVALAANDEHFAAWRLAMGKALGRIAGLEQTAAGYDGEARLIFQEELGDVVRLIAGARSKATFKGAFGPNLSSFGVAAIMAAGGAGIAAAVGATVAVPLTLPVAGFWYGGRALWTYCRGGAARRQGTAVQELYNILGNTA